MSKSIEIQAKTIEAAIEEALVQLGASYDEVDVDIIQEAGFLKKAKVKVTLKKTDTAKPEPKQETSVMPSNPNVTQPRPEDPKPEKPNNKSEEKKDNKGKDKSHAKEEKKEHDKKDNDDDKDELPKKFKKTLKFTKELLKLLGNESEITSEITDKSFNINVNGTGVGQIIGKGGEVMNAIQTIISSIAIAHSNGENKRVYFNVEDYKERRGETLKALAIRKAEKVKETGRFIKLEPMNARDRAIIHSALQEIEGIRTYSTGKDPHRCLCIAPKKDTE